VQRFCKGSAEVLSGAEVVVQRCRGAELLRFRDGDACAGAYHVQTRYRGSELQREVQRF
jgi:hypothetical protein